MNLKGGTAKTVTAINMAAILARDYAQRVLLVDADSQANLTEFLGRTPTYADVLRGFILPRVADVLLKSVGIRPTDELSSDDGRAILTAVVAILSLDFAEVVGRRHLIGHSDIDGSASLVGL